MLKIEIINPLKHPRWDASIVSMDRSTFFHSSAWAQVLSESYGYTPLYFSIIRNSNLVGLMPIMEVNSFLTGKRGVSLPFTDMCEPVAEDRGAFKALFEEVAGYGRQAGWQYIELRGGEGFLKQECTSAEHLAHTLDLDGDESKVRAGFKPNIRRNIRRAEKEGIRVELAHSIESVGAFYKLHCRTRRYHGLPPQPLSFFRKIHKHVIVPEKGFVALASFQGRWVAGALFTVFKDQAIYKYAASDRDFQLLRPNNLVMWEAIKWCCRNGIRKLSFGRSDPLNKGLVRFKRAWGSTESNLGYYRYILPVCRFLDTKHSGVTSVSLFRRMPVSVLRMAGEISYKHWG
jgi:hypothetical protein